MSTTAPSDQLRARLHRRVRLIVAVTISWNIIEAVSAASGQEVAPHE